MPRRRISANVAAAQASAVRQRVLDASHAPAFLIEHQIVDDAADGQLAVFLNRIVFEVLVASVAVRDVPPRRITLADAAAQPEAHRRALDVERLVVFEDLDCLAGVDVARGAGDLFQKDRQARRGQKRSGLRDIRTAAVDIQHERLQALR